MQMLPQASAESPADVIAMVTALFDLAEEAENKGLTFAQKNLHWLALTLARDLEAPEG